MKSRAVRVVLLVVALVAQAVAGYRVWDLDRRCATDNAAGAAFDRLARQIVANVAELRGAQQAYVAHGQGEDYWMQKAAGLQRSIGVDLSALRQAATTLEATSLLESAAEQLTKFTQVDQQARVYVKSVQRLSASDIIFTEGAQIATRLGQLVEESRSREQTVRAAASAGRRWVQVYFLLGALLLTLIVLIALVPRTGTMWAEETDANESGLGLSRIDPSDAKDREAAGARNRFDGLVLNESRLAAFPDLGAVAKVCSALAAVQQTSDLPALLEQAATVLDAAGLIVWIADGPDGELRPAVAHGYSNQVLARMGSIPADADNATAAAYRTGVPQTVPGDEVANGALVVPLSTAGALTGAMATELRHGRETDDNTRALALIIGAQLATLFTPSSAPAPPRVETRS